MSNKNDDDELFFDKNQEFLSFDFDFIKEFELNDQDINKLNSLFKKRFNLEIYDLKNAINSIMDQLKYKDKQEKELMVNKINAISEFFKSKDELFHKLNHYLMDISEKAKLDLKKTKNKDVTELLNQKLLDFMKENNLKFKIVQ